MATGAAVKFDADLDSVSHDADIKLGQSVGFTLLPDGGLACVLQDGVIVIGRVPATHIDNVKNGNCRGTIRSIQRSRDEDRRITGINVRWQSQDSGGQPGYNEAFRNPVNEEIDQDDSIQRLSNQQLNTIAIDDKVQWYLRDEKLQEVLKQIDSAPNREQALQSFLDKPNFQEFSDHLLRAIAGEAQPAAEAPQLLEES